jgi:hypothetical protein
MDRELTRTVSLYELLFLFATTPGFLSAARGLWLRFITLRRQRAEDKPDKDRILAAQIGFYVYLALLGLFTIIEMVGIQLMTGPPPTNPQRSAAVTGFVIFYVALVLLSTWAAWMAGRLTEELVTSVVGDIAPVIAAVVADEDED